MAKEKIPIRAFEIDTTTRCNFRCGFCSQDGVARKGDIAVEDAKRLIKQIRTFCQKEGKNIPVCLAGGEPFLHPNAVEIIAFAVKTLGRDNVEVTTNLSALPKTSGRVIRLFERIGKPKINLSLDREHLKFLKDAKTRIRAISEAAEKAGVRLHVVSVAENAYQQKHPWPREIAQAIPKKLRAKAEVRLEVHSPKHRKAFGPFLRDAIRGKEPRVPESLMLNMSITPFPVFRGHGIPATIAFAPDGRAYIFSQHRGFYFPQLSIGNWKREPLNAILNENLAYKHNMIRGWLGLRKYNTPLRPGIRIVEEPDPKKLRLFAKQAQRRFQRQKKPRRAK